MSKSAHDPKHDKIVVLGPKYSVRLSDLQDNHIIRIDCFACKHIGYLLPTSLEKRWKGYIRLATLEGYMVCAKCGNRTANSWKICLR